MPEVGKKRKAKKKNSKAKKASSKAKKKPAAKPKKKAKVTAKPKKVEVQVASAEERLLENVEFALNAGQDFLVEDEEVSVEATAPEAADIDVADELAALAEASLEEVQEESAEEVTASDEENDTLFIDSDQLVSIIESILFASDKPVSVSQIKGIFTGTNIVTKDIKKALEEMQGHYAEVTRGVTLEEVTSGYQLRTKVDNLDFMKRSVKGRPFRLSGAALEVLSIIAYKQPMIKSQVDEIRGVESSHLVRALMEKGLVCFQGKSELPGKPMQYGTTKKFLEIFGLRNLKELPALSEIDQLIPEGIGDEEDEKETLSDITDNMGEEMITAYSEGEEELGQISEKLQAIDTSSEFFEQEKQRQKEKREREKAEDIREAIDMDEEVSNRDRNWLTRFDEAQVVALEAKEAEAQEAAEEASPVDLAEEAAGTSDSIEPTDSVSEEAQFDSFEDVESIEKESDLEEFNEADTDDIDL